MKGRRASCVFTVYRAVVVMGTSHGQWFRGAGHNRRKTYRVLSEMA